MRTLLFLAVFPLLGQQVTISSQAGTSFVASFGSQLPAVALYSAEVCSSPGVSVASSWGNVRQIAEQNGINIIDPSLAPATAQRAQNKTTLHKILIGVGEAGLATAVIAVFHGAPVWLVEMGAGLSGVAQVVGIPLTASETQAQANANTVLANLADPSAQFSVSGGACTQSKLFLGNSIKGFRPIIAQLPIGPISVPATRREEPRSEVPGAFTHPATNDVEVASWELPLANIEYVAFAGARQ